MRHEWSADAPIRGTADIAALEAVPLAQRITCWDINEWLRRGRRIDPDKAAVTYYPAGDPDDPALVVRYRELDEQVCRVSNLFHALGVGRDDAVVLLGPTLPDSYAVVMAGMACGVVCCVNWMLPAEPLLELIRAARARVVVALGPAVGYQVWEGITAIRDRLAPGTEVFSLALPGGAVLPESDLLLRAAGQPAVLQFDDARGADDIVAYVHSGGTTGAPKLVRLRSRGMVHKAWTLTMTMAHGPDDVLFSDMPMFHIAGLVSCLVIPVVLGSSLVIPTPMGARDKTFIANYWRFVAACRISFLHAVPTTLGVLAANPPNGEDVSSLHDYATTGSTSLPVDVARTMEARAGIRLLMTYGATEFTQNVTQAPRNGDPRYGACGIRNPYTDIRIVELQDDGDILRDCAVDEIGCVLVRSPGNAGGYVDTPANAGVFREDGWINNGDLGRLDADGYLWLTGRAKDLIIRGGHNIDPAEIEAALRGHPAVAMAAAVGMPDAYAGELPVAYVVLRDGAAVNESELVAFAAAHVSERAAVPKAVFVLPDMPLTDVRKIAKVVLRHDAIRRVFERVVADEVGRHVEVSVVADKAIGTVAHVIVPEGWQVRVEAALGAYTIRSVVEEQTG